MSAIKPRKVDSSDFFLTDRREENKFWYLDPVVQPIVLVKGDGTFQDPDLRPVVMDYGEEDAILGNLEYVAGVIGEVWTVFAVTLTSNAGGNYQIEDDGVIISQLVAIALGATDSLLPFTEFPVAGGSVITINGGLAADLWNIRVVRIL